LLLTFLYVGSDWVLYLLLFLSVVSAAIALERLFHFYKQRDDLDALRDDFSKRLTDGDIDGARQRLAQSPSVASRVLLEGLSALDRGASSIEEVLAGAMQWEKLRLERGLAFLGTLGNNAPFLGLFGTVLGIIRSFRELATNTIEGTQAVMSGIAEALVATAVGLLVALPAVAVFNAFRRAISAQMAATDALGRSLLAHAKAQDDDS